MTKNKCSHQKQRGTKRKIGKTKSIGIKWTFPSLKTNEEKVPLKQLIAHTKIEVSKSFLLKIRGTLSNLFRIVLEEQLRLSSVFSFVDVKSELLACLSYLRSSYYVVALVLPQKFFPYDD